MAETNSFLGGRWSIKGRRPQLDAERGRSTYDDDKTLFFAVVQSFNAAAAAFMLPRLQKGLFFKRPTVHQLLTFPDRAPFPRPVHERHPPPVINHSKSFKNYYATKYCIVELLV